MTWVGDASARIKVDVDVWPVNAGVSHGTAKKDMIVLHETVSPDYAGLSDLVQTSGYLARQGYGVHGVIDKEGHLAWSVGHPNVILYHAASGNGRVNTRSIGFELVSRVMLDKPDNTSRWKLWWSRDKQLDKLAQMCAFLSKHHGIPLRYSDATVPGITTHWQVTKTWRVAGGHVDCWPRHLGGYFPALRVISEARSYYKKWYESD